MHNVMYLFQSPITDTILGLSVLLGIVTFRREQHERSKR